MSEFLVFAKQIVYEAGLIAQQLLPGPEIVRHKQNGETVTAGDQRVEEFVISSLQARFPEHGFDSEERGKVNAEAEYVWTLDPIDGTRYYADGVPLWAVSLALTRREERLLGVVYSPPLHQMYSAVAGQDAVLNGSRIACSRADGLGQISVCLEIPNRNASAAELEWAMDKMQILVENTYRTRILGVGSLALCFCAAGAFDVYVNLGSALKPCDVAGGRIILEAAGGMYLSPGSENNKVVAGPPALCSAICKLLGF